MSNRHLKTSVSKTEVLSEPFHAIFFISISSISVFSLLRCQTGDPSWLLSLLISNSSGKPGWSCLQNTPTVWPLSPTCLALSLVQASASSHLLYCNSLLPGLLAFKLAPMKPVHITASMLFSKHALYYTTSMPSILIRVKAKIFTMA